MQVVEETIPAGFRFYLQAVFQYFPVAGIPDHQPAYQDDGESQCSVSNNGLTQREAAVAFVRVEQPAVQAHHLHEEALSVGYPGYFGGIRVDESGCFLARQYQLPGTFRVGGDTDTVDLDRVGQLLASRFDQGGRGQRFPFYLLDEGMGRMAKFLYLRFKYQYGSRQADDRNDDTERY